MARDVGRTGHNLSHQMINKVDRAGRLLTEAQKQAIHFEKMKNNPNSDWWNQQAHPLDDELIDYIGKPAFDDFIDTFPDDVQSMSLYYAIKQKLAEEKEYYLNNLLDFPTFWIGKAETELNINTIVATRILRMCKVNPYVDSIDDFMNWLGAFLKAFDDGESTIDSAEIANKKAGKG